MTLSLLTPPRQQFFDNIGRPNSGGWLYSYEAGTPNLLATYSDSGMSFPNANPIVLDSAGRPSAGAIYLLPQAYKFVLCEPPTWNGNAWISGPIIWSQDNISDAGSIAVAVFATASGATHVGYGATTVAAELLANTNQIADNAADIVAEAAARTIAINNAISTLSGTITGDLAALAASIAASIASVSASVHTLTVNLQSDSGAGMIGSHGTTVELIIDALVTP